VFQRGILTTVSVLALAIAELLVLAEVGDATGFTISAGVTDNATYPNNKRPVARGSDGKWHAVYLKGPTPNLFYASSADGQTWNEEQVTSQTGDDRQRIARDRVGLRQQRARCMVRRGMGGSLYRPISQADLQWLAKPGGRREAVSGQFWPSLAIDSSDNLHVVWLGYGWGPTHPCQTSNIGREPPQAGKLRNP